MDFLNNIELRPPVFPDIRIREIMVNDLQSPIKKYYELDTLVRKQDDLSIWRLVKVVRTFEYPVEQVTEYTRNQVINTFLRDIYTVILVHKPCDMDDIDWLQDDEIGRLRIQLTKEE